MTDASTAESPLPWTADAVATHISDVLAGNYFAPEGALPDVGYQGPDDEGAYVVWVESSGTPVQIAVVVMEVEPDGGVPTVHVSFDR
jgi:hypothetical protein